MSTDARPGDREALRKAVATAANADRVAQGTLQTEDPAMQNDKSTEKDIVRIDLTQPQREQVKQATGKDAEAIELGVEELEQRIAPIRWQG